jgi:hypothetical protein
MAMYPIATYNMTSGGTNFADFLSIPQIYEDLHIRYVTRDIDNCCPNRGMFLEVNGNSVTNNGSHRITTTGNGTSVGVTNTLNTGRFDWSDIPGGIAVSNVFATGIIDISNYSNTSQLKTFQLKGGYVDGSNTGMVYHGAMLWNSTTAISSLRLYSNLGFAIGSSVSLYGITREG